MLAGLGAAFAALALRIVTARVVGANIGGGMAIMFGPFIVLPHVALATARAVAAP